MDVYHRRLSHRRNHAVQGRLADSNRNLGVRALLLLGALGRAMGPAVERAARQCLAPALGCLADKKKPVRELCGRDAAVAIKRTRWLLLFLSGLWQCSPHFGELQLPYSQECCGYVVLLG